MKNYSRQREAILSVISSAHTHPTADWIYNETRKLIPNISLGTVYRNLALLSRTGHILKLDLGTGSEHFDGDISSHYHIVCKKCNQVTDVYEHEDSLNAFASKYFKGKITGHSLVFFGECENCSAKI